AVLTIAVPLVAVLVLGAGMPDLALGAEARPGPRRAHVARAVGVLLARLADGAGRALAAARERDSLEPTLALLDRGARAPGAAVRARSFARAGVRLPAVTALAFAAVGAWRAQGSVRAAAGAVGRRADADLALAIPGRDA